MTAQTIQKPNNDMVEAARPVRRVGSLTLGLCLIAAGVFGFAYAFVPNFEATLLLKAAPAAALCLLGCEVLYCAARPDKMKYDFASVFICLLLLAGLAVLTALWVVAKPRLQHTEKRLKAEYVSEVYGEFEREATGIKLSDVYADLQLYDATGTETLEDLSGSYERLDLYVQLYGPYDSEAGFAADCAKLLEIIKQLDAVPTRVLFTYNGSVQEYELDLHGEAQINWNEQQLEQGINCYYTSGSGTVSEIEVEAENAQ